MQPCTVAIVHKPVGRVALIECCLMDDFLHANLPPEMKEGEGTCCDVHVRGRRYDRGVFTLRTGKAFSRRGQRADTGGNTRLRPKGPARMGLSVGIPADGHACTISPEDRVRS